MIIEHEVIYIDFEREYLLRVGGFNEVYDRFYMDEGEEYTDEELEELARYIDQFTIGGYATLDGQKYKVIEIDKESDSILLQDTKTLESKWHRLDTENTAVPSNIEEIQNW